MTVAIMCTIGCTLLCIHGLKFGLCLQNVFNQPKILLSKRICKTFPVHWAGDVVTSGCLFTHKVPIANTHKANCPSLQMDTTSAIWFPNLFNVN